MNITIIPARVGSKGAKFMSGHSKRGIVQSKRISSPKRKTKGTNRKPLLDKAMERVICMILKERQMSGICSRHQHHEIGCKLCEAIPLSLKDREFLIWIHERLQYVHKESPLLDYMHKLRAVISSIPEDQETPNDGGGKKKC